MIKNRIKILCCTLLLLSCSKKEVQNENAFHVDIHKSKEIAVADWFSEIEIVPLETIEESLLKDYFGLDFKYAHQRYYVHDRGQSAVFVFDSVGKFIFSTLPLMGEGPEQYNSMTDFAINPVTGNLEIIDPFGLKIVVYDKDGRFLKKIKLSSDMYPIGKFTSVSEDLYILARHENKTNYLRFFSAEKQRIIKEVMPQPDNTEYLCHVNSIPFYWYNDRLHFSFVFSSNEVYQMDDDLNFSQKYAFDFGKYTFRHEVLPAGEDKKFYWRFETSNKEKYAFPWHKLENDRFVFCFYEYNKGTFIYRYHKQTGQQEIISNKFSDGGQMLMAYWLTNDYIYNFVEPDWVSAMLPDKYLSPEMQKVVARLVEDDNPVILKFKLK